MRILAFCLALALAVGAAPAVVDVTTPAQAQTAQRKNPISSFFNTLFGGLTRKDQPRRAAPTPQRSIGGKGIPQGAAGTHQRGPVAAQKDEDAKRVVVFGDFFAAGLESGLKEAFLESSSVLVSGLSDPASGLVREDHFNWPAALNDWLDNPENRLDIAVVLIGANDRQGIREGGTEHDARSERWRELYGQRVDAIIDIFAKRKIPLYWVSLPPVASGRMSQDYAYFNDIYRERAYRQGIQFVDIWNSFVDENGNYVAGGPDVNGEQRQLRAEDGLHFTAAGNRKLAHFVAREIRRDFGREGGLFLALPQGPTGPQPFMPSDEQIRTGVGEVVALTGVQGGAGTTLAGGPDPTPAPPRDSAYFQVILEGEPLKSAPGRADDFSWPRKSAPLPTAAIPPPSTPDESGQGAEQAEPAGGRS